MESRCYWIPGPPLAASRNDGPEFFSTASQLSPFIGSYAAALGRRYNRDRRWHLPKPVPTIKQVRIVPEPYLGIRAFTGSLTFSTLSKATFVGSPPTFSTLRM